MKQEKQTSLIALTEPSSTDGFVEFANQYISNEKINEFMNRLARYLANQIIEKQNFKPAKLLISTSGKLDDKHDIDLYNLVTVVDLSQEYNNLVQDEDLIELLQGIKAQNEVKYVLIIGFGNIAIKDL